MPPAPRRSRMWYWEIVLPIRQVPFRLLRLWLESFIVHGPKRPPHAALVCRTIGGTRPGRNPMAELKLSNLMMSVPVPTTLAAVRPPASRKEPAAARMLHVLNGDNAADQLRRSNVQGEITLSADVLHEGP